jgi:DNA modification methylase
MDEFQLILGDAKVELDRLLSDSIQCIVTSPPYYKCRKYQNANLDPELDTNPSNSTDLGQEDTPTGYIRDLCDVFDRAKRPLKQNGLLWVVIGDSKAKKDHNDIGCHKGEFIGIPWLFSFEMRRRGWRIQQECIWAKNNPVPTSSTRMLTPSHETVFMFSQNDMYKFDPRKIVVKSKSTQSGTLMPPIGGLKLAGGVNSSYSGNRPISSGTARRRDVFHIPTSKLPEAHFAPYPEDLIEPLIIASTEPNDIVCDMFCGSGTTGIVAQRNHLQFIGIEYNSEYFDLSLKRITQSSEHSQEKLIKLTMKIVS